MTIEILDLAKRDLLDGFHFYEAQGHGLGAYFLSHIFSDIETLQITAGVHFRAHGDYYRLLSQKFPFAIYYTTSGALPKKSIINWQRYRTASGSERDKESPFGNEGIRLGK
jgi:hypothetical protein